MSIDLAAAAAFMATHARALDRRRFELLTNPGPASAQAALDALAAYSNPDGGYGYGLEPDLRSTESQPASTAHAFEVFAEAAPMLTSQRAIEACDWLNTAATLPDGGVPFALPVTDPAGCAPFWAGANPNQSALQISAFVALHVHRLAGRDPAVAALPWLERLTDYCIGAIRQLDDQPFAILLAFCVQLLDKVYETRPEAAELLDKLGRGIPADGKVPVVGGADGETMRALDFAPVPDRPARALFSRAVIDAELERVASQQHDDGGWRVDFDSYSPAATFEWSGYATVGTIRMLRDNGLLDLKHG